ncbi:MAG: hypothetical protein C0478_05745 [Planctomyces sp.]|nr:hypothetical protein [Planctomyces sp.]
MERILMISARRFPVFLAVGTAVLLQTVSGCGSRISEADGMVTYQGRPVVCGAVIFVGPDGMTKVANIDENTGRYYIEGVGAGTVGVAVFSTDPAFPRDTDNPSNPQDPQKKNWNQPNVDRSSWRPLPSKYEMVHTSGLTVQLIPGLNCDVNIELQ